MSQLKETLHTLAFDFINSVMEAIRQAPIEEINGSMPTSKGRSAATSSPRAGRPAKGARLARRSAEQIEEVVDSIATLLRKNPEGLRAENIRTALDLDVREVPRVLRMGVESKKLVILSGQKRSTTYGLPGSRKVSKKPAKKPAAKKPAAGVKKPTKAKKPSAKKPIKKAAKKPTTKPTAKKPAVKKTPIEKPAAAADKPITKQLEAAVA